MRSLLGLMFLVALPASAADVVLLPFTPGGVVASAEVQQTWWSAHVAGATAAAEDAGRGAPPDIRDFFLEQLADDGASCLANVQCAAELAAADGHAHALRAKIAPKDDGLTITMDLIATDPFASVRSVRLTRSVEGEAAADLVELATRYVLQPLAKANGAGKIDVNADVAGAAVRIDGKPAGVVPLAGHVASAGVHLVEVSTDDRNDAQLVDVAADELSSVSSVLSSGPKVAVASTGGGGGGSTLALVSLGTGATLALVGGAVGVFSFLEADRLNAEIRDRNANGGFAGNDDPELVRIRDETTFTHILTGSAVVGAVLGVGLLALGTGMLVGGE